MVVVSIEMLKECTNVLQRILQIGLDALHSPLKKTEQAAILGPMVVDQRMVLVDRANVQ